MISKNINLFIRVIAIGLLVSLVGCAKINLDRPQVPANTVGSFNFTKVDGEGGLVIFNKGGQVVKPSKPPKPGKTIFEAKIKFIQVNPCYVEVCSGTAICETYLISPGACPPGF